MPRPRIEGMDKRIIESFISRGIYPSQKEVFHAAFSALVREQKRKEAAQKAADSGYDETTYKNQFSSLEDSHLLSYSKLLFRCGVY